MADAAERGEQQHVHSLGDFSYSYLPLGWFRLLRILATTPTLKCVIKHFTLSAPPKYSAISYVWGTDPASVPIILNGNKISITPNLYDALVGINDANATKCTWLWADGICINQDTDPEEKARQVRAMAELFSASELTVFWLGKAGDDSDTGMNAIRLISLCLGPAHKYRIEDENRARQILPPIDSYVWAVIRKLLARPWFERLWVLQEAALSLKGVFLCGRTTAAAWEFFNFVGLVFASLPLRGYLYLGVDWAPGKFPLPGLSSTKKVTNPRDQIYGMIGMLEKGLREQILIDYEISTEETYVRFSRSAVHMDPSLRLLELKSSYKSIPLPSWCPDFGEYLIIDATIKSEYFNAGYSRISPGSLKGSSTSEDQKEERPLSKVEADSKIGYKVSPSQQLGVLELRGFRIDTVKGSRYCSDDSKESENAWLLASEKIYQRDCAGNGKTSGGVFALTITGSHYIEGFEVAQNPNQMHLRYLAYKKYNMNPILQLDVQNEDEKLMAEQFDWAIYSGCTFFTTESGRIGLAHGVLESGDKIVVLYGAAPLFALRFNEPGNRAVLLGTAFMYGFMDLDQMPPEARGADETFVLE